MLTKAEFKELKKHTGVQVTWLQAKPPEQSGVIDKAIVQNNRREADAIINAYGINGVNIQVDVDDVPVIPEKFDVFTDVIGQRHVVDTVIAHRARDTGVIRSYTIYCKGK